ncbi:hypothetical protein Ddc_15682 [Ditylenchus destructor]|nr:hypothetical protein Ddc_15682 [Ditylenchus destructor]
MRPGVSTITRRLQAVLIPASGDSMMTYYYVEWCVIQERFVRKAKFTHNVAKTLSRLVTFPMNHRQIFICVCRDAYVRKAHFARGQTNAFIESNVQGGAE